MSEAHKLKITMNPIAIKCEDNFSLGPRFRFVEAVVPDANFASTILSMRNDALEGAKGQFVVIDLNRQTLNAWFFRDAFWDCPTFVDSILFKAEIEMMRACMVFLDDKSRHTTHSFMVVAVEDQPRPWRMLYSLFKPSATLLPGQKLSFRSGD